MTGAEKKKRRAKEERINRKSAGSGRRTKFFMNQNTSKLADDPRLTAYALGELEGAERAAFEAELSGDAAAQAAAGEIRAMEGRLRTALAQEGEPVAAVGAERRGRARVLRFPQLYFLIGGLAAAGFAVVVVLRGPGAGVAVKPAQAEKRLVTTITFPEEEAAKHEADGTQRMDGAKPRLTDDLGLLALAGNKPAAPLVLGSEGSVAEARAALARDGLAQAAEAGRARVGIVSGTGSRSATVEAGGYAVVRKFLEDGRRPPREAVRIEELLNHFTWGDAAPAAGSGEPLAATLEAGEAPWAAGHRLVRVGLRGRGAEAGAAVAWDVRVEVKFNPARVAEWRLVGYEGRDGKPFGAMGAGRGVVALYEVVPVAGAGDWRAQIGSPQSAAGLLTLNVRWKVAGTGAGAEREWALADGGARWGGASADFKFAAAVAGFGMLLRDSPQRGATTWAGVRAWAEAGRGADVGGERAEFLALVRRAEGAEE